MPVLPGVTTSLFTALALGAGFPEWPTFDLGPARVVKCRVQRITSLFLRDRKIIHTGLYRNTNKGWKFYTSDFQNY